MPEAARVLIVPAEICVYSDIMAPQVFGQIAHRGFQSRFCHAHDIVIGHNFFGAVIGHGQAGCTRRQKLLSGLQDGGEGIG